MKTKRSRPNRKEKGGRVREVISIMFIIILGFCSLCMDLVL